MAYPIGAGGAVYPAGSNDQATPGPVYSGTFIPTLWSAKVIEKFYSATVLAAIANTDYEGDIANQGDKVIIRTKPTININDYTADTAITVQRPTSNVVELLIDKGKYFATILDDVMEVQADLNQLGMWAEDASEQMKIVIDMDVLANISADFSADNVGAAAGRISGNINLGDYTATGTPRTVTTADVIGAIVDAGQVLDEQNIPETGRWMVIPAWLAAMIKKSELRDASLTGDGVSMLRNGRLGMIDRFTLYGSNHLPSTNGETEIMFGHSHGLTFASQMTKMETLRSEMTFGTIMRGLQVYGYKVTDGTALGRLVVVKG